MDDDAFPQLIDERERRAWLGLVATSTLLPTALDSRLQRDAGMNLFEYRVMKTLAEQPDGSMQLKSLAAIADGSLSRLSHVITRLERRGWVRRYSECTGRATHARLTDQAVRRS